MKEICENIYKKSRKSAGLEQIEAADKLGVSARSLQNYESELKLDVNEVKEAVKDIKRREKDRCKYVD